MLATAACPASRCSPATTRSSPHVPPPAAHPIATASRNATASRRRCWNCAIPRCGHCRHRRRRGCRRRRRPAAAIAATAATRAPRLRAPPRWLAPRPSRGGQLGSTRSWRRWTRRRGCTAVSTRGRAASALAALSFLFLSFWSPFFQIPMALALFALVYFWYWRKDPNFEELLAQAKQKAQAGLSSVDKNSLLAAMPSVSFGSAQQQCSSGRACSCCGRSRGSPHLRRRRWRSSSRRRRRHTSPSSRGSTSSSVASPRSAAHRGARHRAARRRRRRGAAAVAARLRAHRRCRAPAADDGEYDGERDECDGRRSHRSGGARARGDAAAAGAPAEAMILVRLRDAVLQAAKFQKWPKAKL